MPDLGIIEEGGRVFKKFSNLHQSTSCSDVTLVLGDTKFVAHRFVLGANSRVFETFLFGTDFAEHNQKEVKVDAPVEAFKILLQYMYTGSLVLQEFDVVDVADFLELCHRYEILELQEQIENYLCVAVGAENAVEVLQVIKPLDIKRLEELCWYLIEMSIDGHYEVDLTLPHNFLAELVGERERRVSEVNLFKLVDKSLKLDNFCTEEQKDYLLSKFELNKISTVDLFKVVRPANCFDVEKIYETVEKRAFENAKEIHQGMEIECKATVNDEKDSEIFFTTGSKFNSFDVKINKIKNILVVDLEKLYSFNHLKFCLEANPNSLNLNYLIQISKDGTDWIQISEFSSTLVDNIVTLYFPVVSAKLIKICFTTDSKNEKCICSLFNILMEESPPKALGSYIIPEENAALLNQAIVVLVNSKKKLYKENQLLNGIYEDAGLKTPYTAQIMEHGSLIVAFIQPYILNSCRFRLWDFDGRKYSYKVEVSYDGIKYDLISDKSDEKVDGWQVIKFSPRPVQLFQITGISATVGNELRLAHFEAKFEEYPNDSDSEEEEEDDDDDEEEEEEISKILTIK